MRQFYVDLEHYGIYNPLEIVAVETINTDYRHRFKQIEFCVIVKDVGRLNFFEFFNNENAKDKYDKLDKKRLRIIEEWLYGVDYLKGVICQKK